MRDNFKSLLVTVELQTVIVTFNRPDLRNPLSVEIIGALSAVLDSIESDRAIERLIFTGTSGVFASGADLREIANIEEADSRGFALRGQRLLSRLANLTQLTVAAVDGPCFGGALDLAIACKRRIASPKALFSHPGSGLGIITGWGGTQRLPRLIGQGRALEMFFTASPVSASEALRIGLVDEVVENPLTAALTVV